MSANSAKHGLKRWVSVPLAFKLDHLKPVEQLIKNFPLLTFLFMSANSPTNGLKIRVSVPQVFKLDHMKPVGQLLKILSTFDFFIIECQ